jgi:ribosomal protein S18 acetylase RimI-like enzyme
VDRVVATNAGAKDSTVISLSAISQDDRQAFLEMAEQHFRGLNPAFSPHEDWKNHYFENILNNPRIFARWILFQDERAGFVLYGLEAHKFLPRLTGMIYELYVAPEFRRKGIARACAAQVIEDLQTHSPSKIELEVMRGNIAAEALWRSLGFETVSTRMVMTKSK